jgi:iron-sulfur cluster assembly accessory protein
MLIVTDVASRKLNEIIAGQPEPVFGLRVQAFAGCCSGPSYGMALAAQSEAGDWVGEFGGIKVLVDRESAPLLEGASIDYVETPQGSGFTISNPNAVSGGGCGCGGSSGSAESGSEHAPARGEAGR